jgi:uncharacterized protein (TIGR02231 family)
MIDVDTRIATVTVLEDRAQIVREATVHLPAGVSTVVLTEVAPVVSDKSLRVEVDGVAVPDVRIVRSARIARADKPEALAAVQAELRRLDAETLAHTDRVESLAEEGDRFSKALKQFLQDAVDDTAWGAPDAEGWALELARLQAYGARMKREEVEADAAYEQVAERMSDLRAQEAALLTPASTVGAAVHATVSRPAEGAVTLRVHYVVPGACWRPRHTAALEGDTLRWQTLGCVWQHTGEDWSGARVLLSTQRASLGAEPPKLVEDRLYVQPKQEQVVVGERDEVVQTTGDGVDLAVADGLPGIDDGGEVRTLEVAGTVDIVSDGRPNLLPLFDFSSPAEVALVAMPELATHAIWRCRTTNRASVPILAGPVELVRDGGRVGRTTVLFIAPGERLSLGFGPDPAVRIHRRAASEAQESSALSRWLGTKHRVTLKLSNLAGDARRLEITERVPVSEVPQVEIEVDATATSEGRRPDDDGMVTWKVTLDGRDTRELTLAYTVSRRKGVVGL